MLADTLEGRRRQHRWLRNVPVTGAHDGHLVLLVSSQRSHGSRIGWCRGSGMGGSREGEEVTQAGCSM